MPWEKEVSKFLTIGNLFLVVAFGWGVWYMFKVKKFSQELDKIDEELEREIRSSSF
ncbi:MAG: hypothetical protein I3270_02075 [Candidatus Moeniiplasma glomeromycotorum]|nr:hypothetical protein [Candidatus Moeniiplasma glomeromycotorum]MCE8162485.1 hypothetical protein [Candidatus Moeniiplasma glomeromycotorum]MCE8166412.1 hypothetical protein [Candidatus Moeniiplasma glomeromycotorum]MCE8166897.1 hypothetical protein [Candidatus Moeniiplasma glomeromycotorum]